jgi:hypothetical protein
MVDGEELFYAQENAVVVKDAEEYYRKAYAGGAVTWNLRDRHMHNTLKEILQHYSEKRGWPRPKAGMPFYHSLLRRLGRSRRSFAPTHVISMCMCVCVCVLPVVWAHNSHLGDARATSVSEMGEFNIGQLVRRSARLTWYFVTND